MSSTTTRQIFSIIHPYKFELPFSSYMATLFILLPIEFDKAVRGKHQLVKEWEDKKSEACLPSKEGDLLESLVKKYNVLHNMQKVDLDMITFICSWHLVHASSKEKSKTLSDWFREIQTVGEVESEDDWNGGGGGGNLS